MKNYYNVMEDIVPTLVRVMMFSPEYQTYCHCDQCMVDIIALTLNNVPPRYVTSEEKRNIVMELYKKDFMTQNLNKHIRGAIQTVNKNPHHS